MGVGRPMILFQLVPQINDLVVIYAYNEHNELVRVFVYPDERILHSIQNVVEKDVFKVIDF